MKWKEFVVDGLKLQIEPLDGVTFHSDGEVKSGEDVERELIERVLRFKDELLGRGYKRVQIASIQYFYMHGLTTTGRFLPLNTMFLARLLKR